MCDISCVLFYIFATISAVTLPLYFVTILTIIKFHKQLKSSFFIFCVSSGIADICFILHTTTFRTIPKIFFYDKIKDNEVFATVSKMGFWSLYLSQVLGVVIIAINRYTALAMPMQYKQLWTKRAITVAIILQWTIPIPTIIPLFFPCCSSYYNNTMLYPTFKNKQVHKAYFTFDVITEAGILAPMIIAMYIMSFYKAHSFSKEHTTSQKKQQHKGSNKSRNAEFRLALTGVVISILYLTMVFTYICSLFGFQPKFIVLLFLYSSNLLACCNPWTLLAFSTQYRKYFMGFILCKSVQQIETAIHAHTLRSHEVPSPLTNHEHKNDNRSRSPSIKSVSINTQHI